MLWCGVVWCDVAALFRFCFTGRWFHVSTKMSRERTVKTASEASTYKAMMFARVGNIHRILLCPLSQMLLCHHLFLKVCLFFLSSHSRCGVLTDSFFFLTRCKDLVAFDLVHRKYYKAHQDNWPDEVGHHFCITHTGACTETQSKTC